MDSVRVGWWEWVGLPGSSRQVLRAKCDTGAATSAVHAEGLELSNHGEITLARFKVMPDDPVVELQVTNSRQVRSSNGEHEVRPVVLMPIQLAGVTFAIEATLTNRISMQYPMLLGRSALAGRFVVDPAHGRLHPKPRVRK